MNHVTFDVETTGATNETKGHPFTPTNKLCLLGYKDGNTLVHSDIEYSTNPYGRALADFQASVNSTDCLVGFNIKFDLHWSQRYGIIFEDKALWDCQLAHFIITHQQNPFPSLDEVLTYYGQKPKLDVVRTEYWDKGIDTDQVPWEILTEYADYDVAGTDTIYLLQEEYLKHHPQMRKLIWVSCQDLLVTQAMEWNGLKYDLELSKEKGNAILEEIRRTEEELREASGIRFNINWGSNDHVSAFLYGGVCKVRERVAFPFVYKDGRTVTKERWELVEYQLPRLVEPLPRSELAKAGYFSTDKKTLVKLKGNKRVRHLIQLLLAISTLDKLAGTYYFGIPAKFELFGWENEIMHGKLNHATAQTGRLSSSDPNLQNMDSKVTECLITRF